MSKSTTHPLSLQSPHDENRLKYACEPCHTRKIRCFAAPDNQSGLCDPCRMNGRKCLFALKSKTGRPAKSSRPRLSSRHLSHDTTTSPAKSWSTASWTTSHPAPGSNIHAPAGTLDLRRSRSDHARDFERDASYDTTDLDHFQGDEATLNTSWQTLLPNPVPIDTDFTANTNFLVSSSTSIDYQHVDGDFLTSTAELDHQQYASAFHDMMLDQPLDATQNLPSLPSTTSSGSLGTSHSNTSSVEVDTLTDAYGTALECAYNLHALKRLVKSCSSETIKRGQDILALFSGSFDTLFKLSTTLHDSLGRVQHPSSPCSTVWNLVFKSVVDATVVSETLLSMNASSSLFQSPTLLEQLHRATFSADMHDRNIMSTHSTSTSQSRDDHDSSMKTRIIGGLSTSISPQLNRRHGSPNSLNLLIEMTCMDYHVTCFKKLLQNLPATLSGNRPAGLSTSEGRFTVQSQQAASCKDTDDELVTQLVWTGNHFESVGSCIERLDSVRTKIRSRVACIRMSAET